MADDIDLKTSSPSPEAGTDGTSPRPTSSGASSPTDKAVRTARAARTAEEAEEEEEDGEDEADDESESEDDEADEAEREQEIVTARAREKGAVAPTRAVTKRPVARPAAVPVARTKKKKKRVVKNERPSPATLVLMAVTGMAVLGFHMIKDFPYQPVLVIGIVIVMYAYVQIGSLNEIEEAD